MIHTTSKKIWLVTGASKGLGLSLTKLLLNSGHKVAATSRNADSLKKEITANDDHFFPVTLDITNDADVKKTIKDIVDHFGRIDVVVNNAGYSLVGSMEEMTDAEFRSTLDVNLFGTVNIIRNVISFMRKQQSGHVINISSNAGYIGFANASSYNASKFAVIGLTEALAQEVKNFGIKATVIAPGQFRTEFMNSIQYVQNRIEEYGVDEAEKMWTSFSGQQPGDPEKLVRIILEISDLDQPPLHLLIGPDTYDLVKEKRAEEEKEFEHWKHVTLSTNFD